MLHEVSFSCRLAQAEAESKRKQKQTGLLRPKLGIGTPLLLINILLVKASHRNSPDSRDGRNRLYLISQASKGVDMVGGQWRLRGGNGGRL